MRLLLGDIYAEVTPGPPPAAAALGTSQKLRPSPAGGPGRGGAPPPPSPKLRAWPRPGPELSSLGAVSAVTRQKGVTRGWAPGPPSRQELRSRGPLLPSLSPPRGSAAQRWEHGRAQDLHAVLRGGRAFPRGATQERWSQRHHRAATATSRRVRHFQTRGRVALVTPLCWRCGLGLQSSRGPCLHLGSDRKPDAGRRGWPAALGLTPVWPQPWGLHGHLGTQSAGRGLVPAGAQGPERDTDEPAGAAARAWRGAFCGADRTPSVRGRPAPASCIGHGPAERSRQEPLPLSLLLALGSPARWTERHSVRVL